MLLTVRLDPQAARALNRLAKRRGLSRSELVREALAQYASDDGGRDRGTSPYDAWLDVVGVINAGVRDTSRSTGAQLTGILREQRRARRPR